MVDNEAASFAAIGDYWDTHEISDENSEPVEIEVDLRSATKLPNEK